MEGSRSEERFGDVLGPRRPSYSLPMKNAFTEVVCGLKLRPVSSQNVTDGERRGRGLGCLPFAESGGKVEHRSLLTVRW